MERQDKDRDKDGRGKDDSQLDRWIEISVKFSESDRLNLLQTSVNPKNCSLYITFFFFFFLALLFSGQDLSSPSGIEPMAPAAGVQSFNHWTSRELSSICYGGRNGKNKTKLIFSDINLKTSEKYQQKFSKKYVRE